MNTLSEIEEYYKAREQQLLKKLHQQGAALAAAEQALKQLTENQKVSEDETARQRAAREQQLKDELYRDPLTGIYNRRYYEEVVRKSIGPAGIALMDVDDFKICNDTYGHHAGDMALKTAANAIQSRIRKSDLLIRCGGDEFLLVLPGISTVIGRTEEEAQAKWAELQALIHPSVGLATLAPFWPSEDLTQWNLDAPPPYIPEPPKGINSRAHVVLQLARRENYTVRQLYEYLAGARGHWVVVGTPQSFEAYGCMVRKGDAQFKKLVDDTIAAEQANGNAEKSFNRWFMQPIPPKNMNMNFEMSDEMKALFKAPNDKALH